MSISFEREVARDLVNTLLASPSRKDQTALVASNNLLDPEGLNELLDAAAQLVGSDPGKARALATLCAELAGPANSKIATPRADYILVQTHFVNGEFDAALRLAKRARDGYLALGENLEALRTDVGRMAVLLGQGCYQEALDTGRGLLDSLDGSGEVEVAPTPQESALLAALVHQNHGYCFELMGRYGEALDAYADAEERYQTLGMTERVGEILDNRGGILLQLGRGSEALASHEAAAAIFSRSGLTLSRAQAFTNIGETHLHLGDYKSALEAFERARRLFDSLDALAHEHSLLLDTANAYLTLNLYPEALAAYREVEEALREAGTAHDRARALWSKGSALIAQSEFEEAAQALDGASSLFKAAGNLPLLSGVMLEQASLLAARGKGEVALEAARGALDLVSGQEEPVQAIYAHLRLADLLLTDVEAAEPHLLAARELSERLSLPHLRYRLEERLGRLRRLQGRDEEAQMLLEAAVDEIERVRGTVSHEAMRASFLRDKIAAYEDLLLLHLDRDANPENAFAVSERAKSRALVDLLTGVTKEEDSAAPDDEQLEKLRDLQADLNGIYSQLLGGGAEEPVIPLPDLQRRAIDLERELSRLRLELPTTSDPFVVSLPPEAVRERLSADTTLIAYHVVGDEIVAFVSTRNTLRVVRNRESVESVEKLLRGLEMQWDRFRAGPGFVGRHMDLLQRSTQRILYSLYDELMRPLEQALSEATQTVSDGSKEPQKLILVPHGLLHNVPFHALFDGESYLLERFEISYAPSATVYALCQKRILRQSGRSLVMSVADPQIPAVTGEARAVAEHLPGADLLQDQEATMKGLGRAAANADVLHLACHGLFRADNPMFSALKLHDGWLTAADVMSLDLDGALITLSACESGRSEVFAGDELIGLTRAFLGAGAATLVVSLWLVQDETTARLMESWYEKIESGMGRAAALRTAQIEIKEEFPHPYYWAPFVLTGRR